MTARRAPIWAATAVLLAGLADAATTWVGLRAGLHETNPVARDLFNALGTIPLLVLRVAIPTVGAYLLLRWASRDRIIYLASLGAILFVAFAWSGVAVSNHIGFV